ncbi:MAG: DNA polymerase III subunit gamma/tau [Bacilli bacterium]|nr:DNA polymerase III subunit gamma/tau [Bacilli bacterium]
MSYLALYRKYRPQTFEEVVGQQYVTKILKNTIDRNMTSHAYLFSGPRGTGKTTIAKLIAKLLNCESPINDIPCEKCPSCIAFNEKNHPDIIEMDAASNNGVDEIREIRDKVTLMPSISKYKVYIIDEVHMLSIGAFNALLKTLEEPPQHVIFILATTELYKVPATIISRCQCFNFEKISEEDIVKKLKYIVEKENIKVEEEVLNLIAKYSDGGLRDAINLLDKLVCCSTNITIDDFYEIKGIVKEEELFDIVSALVNGNTKEALEKLDYLGKKGKNLILFATELIEYLKNMLISNNTYGLDKDKIFEMIDILNDTVNNMKNSCYQKVLLEVAFLKVENLLKNIEIVDNEEKAVKKEELQEKPKEKQKEDINNNVEKENEIEANKSNEQIFEINKIRINNALALANKNLLEDLKICWVNLSDYLYNKEFGSVVSFLIDGNVRVVGEKDVIISFKYDSTLENALLNISKIESLIYLIVNKNYKVSVVLDDEWEQIKNKFILDKKNGITYTYKEEFVLEKTQENEKYDKIENKEAPESLKDAVDLFGQDFVEIQ